MRKLRAIILAALSGALIISARAQQELEVSGQVAPLIPISLNGYSGEVPPHWGLTDPTAPTYLMSVRQWETANGLTSGVCSLDLTTDTWHSHPSP